MSLKEDLSRENLSMKNLSLEDLTLKDLSLEDLSLLASSPHGRLEARRQGGLHTVLEALQVAGGREEQVRRQVQVVFVGVPGLLSSPVPGL